MAILMLMRHGKSDWDSDVESDHERPLAPRGEKAAARVGRFLSRSGNQPDWVLSSTAVRAAATANLAAESGQWTCEVTLSAGLYGGGPAEVMDHVRRIGSSVQRLLVVGHNPTWETLASSLTGGGDFRFPTAAVACLRFPTLAWADVGLGRAELLWFVIPRLLG